MSPQLRTRFRIEDVHAANPLASQRQLAKLANTNQSAVKRVLKKLKDGQPLQDAPKSGRPPRLTPELMQVVEDAATGSLTSSSSSIARQLLQSHGIRVASSTIHRCLKIRGLKFGSAKKVPILTEPQKRARIAFAEKHLKQTTDFRGVMFTDSKMFCLNKDDLKCWCKPGSQPCIEQAKYSLKSHVYLGVTYLGSTKPIFVTSSSQKSSFQDAKGNLQKGVGADEYNQNVLPALISDANDLFAHSRFASSWTFQQDNAPCHTAVMNKEFLNQNLPDRWIKDWPPNSPDLSWIENVWSWADRKLDAVREEIKALEPDARLPRFKSEITRVIAELPVDMCQRYVRAISKNLAKVKNLKGQNINR